MPPKRYRKYPEDLGCVWSLVGLIAFWVIVVWVVVLFFL